MLEPPATQPCGARTASLGVCEDFTIANCEMSGFASVEPSRLDSQLYHYRCPPQAKIKFFSFFKGAGFNASRFLGMLFFHFFLALYLHLPFPARSSKITLGRRESSKKHSKTRSQNHEKPRLANPPPTPPKGEQFKARPSSVQNRAQNAANSPK